MFASVKRVSDILPVEGHTAQDAYDLTMKQLTALGCPHWDSDGSFFGKGSQPHLTAGPVRSVGRVAFGTGGGGAKCDRLCVRRPEASR